MDTQEELRHIFDNIKNTLQVQLDLGLEPLLITHDDQHTLEAQKPETRKSPVPTCDETLASLSAAMGDCKRCKLHQGRTCLVFGEGPPNAELMFVGEGPGREEDLAGRPFVGEAGALLTKIIENGMKVKRDEVYICNIVKCRPPKNRDPEPDEIKSCLPVLDRQINIIKPKVICILGRVAGQTLIGGDFKITRDRGKWFSYNGIPAMPTFHPAYLLRYPSAKREVWDDIKQIMGKLGLSIS